MLTEFLMRRAEGRYERRRTKLLSTIARSARDQSAISHEEFERRNRIFLESEEPPGPRWVPDSLRVPLRLATSLAVALAVLWTGDRYAMRDGLDLRGLLWLLAVGALIAAGMLPHRARRRRRARDADRLCPACGEPLTNLVADTPVSRDMLVRDTGACPKCHALVLQPEGAGVE